MNYRRIKSFFAAALAIGAVLAAACPAKAQDAQARIDKLAVKINFRTPAPEPIRARIVSSVESVGSKALKGKTVDEAVAMQASLAQVMKKIFAEVLSGFEVMDLSIEIGPPVEIRLDLDVERPQVESVRFEIQPQAGIHSNWTRYFAAKLKNAESDMSMSLKGTPVGSSRWSGDIATQMVRDRLAAETELAGFEFDPVMEIEKETVVKIAVKPVGQTIRSVSVKTRSATMPSLLIERLKYDMVAQAETLIGLPVEFARANEQDIIDSFYEYLQENSQVDRLGLEVEIKPVFVKKNVILTVMAESKKYSGFLRGKVSIGREVQNPDVEGHLGVFMRKNTEFFSEINFLPGPIDFQFNLGIGQRIGPHLYVAAGRNFVDGLDRMWANYYLTEDIILSWEKNVYDQEKRYDEASIKFKAHDYFSFDLTSDLRHDVWVRFVTNL
ncbi:MAG: hypothetical protein WCX65_03005 [bacterium]